MMRKIICPVCQSTLMVDDAQRVQHCEGCGNLLTVHNASIDKGRNKGRNTFLAVCAIMFLCFMGIMSSDDTSSNEKDTRSYRETSDVTQNKQTTEATKSVKAAETTQKSTASNQNNTTTQKSTTSARNNTTTQKSTATSTTKSTTSTSSTKVNGVTPELKTFCDEYEQLMDIYIYLMLYADEYEEQTGRDAMIDYFAALSKLATFEQAAAELADKEMTDADYAYYTASMLRIELKLLAALSGSDK